MEPGVEAEGDNLSSHLSLSLRLSVFTKRTTRSAYEARGPGEWSKWLGFASGCVIALLG